MTRTPTNVRRGAELLDERLPGWRKAIDPDALDMSDGCDCILGAIFGDYDKGLDVLGLDPLREAQRYGFYLGPGQTWSKIQNAWLRVIAR
jgi:hypothetical protein